MTPSRPLFLIPLLAACAAGPTVVAPAPTPEPPARAAYTATTFDTTWYVTNRARDGTELTRKLSDSLEFGIVVTRFRERVGPGTDGAFVEGLDADAIETVQLDRGEFVRRLRARDSATAVPGGTIMYVHGYAVSFGLAITQTSDIGHRGGHRGPMVAFIWPAHSTIMTWPAPSAILTRAYRDDSLTAIASYGAFRDATTIVRNAVRPGSLTIVGHSMGSRLVAEALTEKSSLRDSLALRPLPALVLFAPDIALARFRDSLAAPLGPVAARRIVYASDEDRLMGLSRLINGDARAGQASAARALVPLGIELVDVTNGRRVNSFVRKFFEPGHGMRFASTALFDFFGVVRGVSAECRAASGLAERDEAGAWRLSDGPIPAEPASCAK
jgi:esterase/lipase superfamily enzyme